MEKVLRAEVRFQWEQAGSDGDGEGHYPFKRHLEDGKADEWRDRSEPDPGRALSASLAEGWS